MGRLNIGTTNAIICIFGILLLWAFCTTAVSGQNENEAYEEKMKGAMDELEDWHNAFDTATDQLALEEYHKKGAEISSWKKDLGLPGPDNAALLYYQAFLLRPEPNEAVFLNMEKVLVGGEPNDQVKTYLGHCLPMIRTVEAAVQIPQCSWGIQYLPGSNFQDLYLISEIRQVGLILKLDALTLAADGHYQAALERCLTIRRMARHVGDETIFLYSFSKNAESAVLSTVKYVLEEFPPDYDILAWLRKELAVTKDVLRSPVCALDNERKHALWNLRNNPDILDWWRKNLEEMAAEYESLREGIDEVLSLSDEELVESVEVTYDRWSNSVARVIESGVPYKDKYDELQEIEDQIDQNPFDFMAFSLMNSYTEATGIYDIHVQDITRFNALMAAIEIYIVKAQTGQLPESLPADLPKDPYTGRDFGYEITQDGFNLISQGEVFQGRGTEFIKFKVKSNP